MALKDGIYRHSERQGLFSPGILIGAPKANTTQEDVIEGGAVFLCPWSNNRHQCTIIPFDTEGNRNISSSDGYMKDYKSNQWFGATVKSLKEKVVACAPLYHWEYLQKFNFHFETSGVTPVGTCLIAVQNFSNYAEYSPCRSKILQSQLKLSGVPDQRFCEAGWSSAITEAGDILLGAPGSYFWQGQLFATSNIDTIVRDYSRNHPVRPLGKKRQTEDAKGKKDNHFEGYSLTVGEFTGDSVKDYVLGAPRAEDSLGSVIILDSVDMKTKQTIVGEQVAAYFGYAVAAMDINSDGRDDILVGAPLFMSRGQDGKLHEVGQAYVYLQDQLGSFKQPTQTLTGTDKFGRFGSAISTLGDLDNDGYNDVAIGAPYAGEDGKGRVLIYLGHATGLHSKPGQELKGTWGPDSVSAGFGFSLQGGSDIDANNYTDLIVGAYDIDKVVLYRARPVITAEAQIILVPDILNPELKKCRLPQDSILVTCFEVRLCVKVKGHGIGQQFALDGQVELDKNKQRSQRRILFLHSHQAQKNFQFPPMRNEQTACHNFTAYLRQESEFKDKLSPIVVTLNCSLSEEQQLGSGGLTPVLSPNSEAWVTKKTRILLDCGNDGICIPDLKLNATVDKSHLIAGDSNPLTVIITAVNKGEGAYETELHIPIPPQVDFINIVRDSKGLTKLSCNPRVENGTQTLTCDLGNPMKSGVQLSAGFHFMVHSLEQVENVTFSMQIKSKNLRNSSSEVVYLTFPVQVIAQSVLIGASLPEKIVLPYVDLQSSATVEVKNESLPNIQHTYELHNNGPSAISDAVLEVDWPAAFLGDSLLFKSKIIPWGKINCTVNASDAENWVEAMSTMSPLSETTENSRHNINKRDVNNAENAMEETIFNLTCTTVTCVKIMCRVGLLEKEKRAVINIHSQLRMEVFVQNRNKQFTFQSQASFIVQEMPYKVQPEEFPSDNMMVQTLIYRSGPEDVLPIPIWCLVVAILGGLLLVALVAFILWKCGFFKRKLPPTEDEGLL
ncbi:integrin alpha-8-like [Stegostoma tigrinum]|uniref:integrin alpha-8-like n=1 Tax=Stegostoma tigrinum TaxID=3053191 RepID=UPI00287027EF|nr:integrin alpha-8-like [Stegostoma tigrinum]